MTTELTTKKYQCDFCKAEYDYKRDAEECERRDIEKQKIKKIENCREFIITQDHLKLLKSMNVDWNGCEYGAPEIDCKRPYGNSNVEDDIAEIIKFPKKGNYDYGEEDWKDEAKEKLYFLHREMQIVLQIVLIVQKFEVGTYIKKDEYDNSSWEKK